ncbi:hypothetical protein FM106_11650 [Brachybacterium faecium]|nr:hypothetical protein FM106_11650 [Brachybacterium faecium]
MLLHFVQLFFKYYMLKVRKFEMTISTIKIVFLSKITL